jgi:hypothetical protein
VLAEVGVTGQRWWRGERHDEASAGGGASGAAGLSGAASGATELSGDDNE